MLGMALGFKVVLVVAAGCYLLALAAMLAGKLKAPAWQPAVKVDAAESTA
jgi:hypothetical protein